MRYLLFSFLLLALIPTAWAGRTFNGSTQYASAASSSDYNSTDITVSLWVYIPTGNSMDGSSFRLIEIGGYNSGSPLDGVALELDYNGGVINGLVWEGGNWVSNIGSGYSFSLDTWTHVAVTARLTTSELNEFYAAGSQSGLDLTSGGRTANSQALTLGANNVSHDGNFFEGYLAELAIFDTNLSASDVSDLAAGGSPVAVNEAALVAYWRMDGSGSTESDYVSSATLTYTGSPGTTTPPTVDDPPAGGTTIPIFQSHQLRTQ